MKNNQTDIDFDLIEAFFFAYRDFTQDADAVLASYHFGRAHHRVLYFVYRYPGQNVAKLLDILRITKQSLARVLKQLIDTGHIRVEAGVNDKRQRALYTTEKGNALILTLTLAQSQRIKHALECAGVHAYPYVEQFLKAMVEQ